MNKGNIYIKITDKYIYTFSKNKIKKYESKYIKDGKVDNAHKLILYLNRLINKSFIKKDTYSCLIHFYVTLIYLFINMFLKTWDY